MDYKNCASRWLLTHCNMMYGTHNVKMPPEVNRHPYATKVRVRSQDSPREICDGQSGTGT